MLAPLVAHLITSAARSITGARSLWLGCGPEPVQRIYFANHSSHGDFVLLWASLPSALRKSTRPVAGADYWQTAAVRRYVINQVFNGVLIDRERHDPQANPLQPMLDALEGGDSLIIFPEGTRNQEDGLLPFKSLPAGATGAGVDRQPQPGHAQGPCTAVAVALHHQLRRTAAARRR
jgi:hypothetical protein